MFFQMFVDSTNVKKSFYLKKGNVIKQFFSKNMASHKNTIKALCYDAIFIFMNPHRVQLCL